MTVVSLLLLCTPFFSIFSSADNCMIFIREGNRVCSASLTKLHKEDHDNSYALNKRYYSYKCVEYEMGGTCSMCGTVPKLVKKTVVCVTVKVKST
jgi:hypothetical protein